MLYKYPQTEYPYERLVRESGNRGRDVEEFEITDTDIFEEDKYWDVFVEVRATENFASETGAEQSLPDTVRER